MRAALVVVILGLGSWLQVATVSLFEARREARRLAAAVDSLQAAPPDTVYMDLGFYEANEPDIEIAEGATPWKNGRQR